MYAKAFITSTIMWCCYWFICWVFVFFLNKISEKVSRGILGFEEIIFFKKQALNSYMGWVESVLHIRIKLNKKRMGEGGYVEVYARVNHWDCEIWKKCFCWNLYLQIRKRSSFEFLFKEKKWPKIFNRISLTLLLYEFWIYDVFHKFHVVLQRWIC
jgi:hypothetical protein